MKPSYLKAPDPARDRWMISYVDVLTILLIFFVVAAAHGVKQEPQKIIAAAPPPAPTPPPEPRQSQLRMTQQGFENRGLDAKLEARGLVITFPQTILFPSGEDVVDPAALPVIEQIVEVLQDIPNRVTLVGHADDVPIHNRRFKNNWELAAARGLAMLELLHSKYGIPESRLSVSSYSSWLPRSPNDTKDGRAGNRRVEIVILDESTFQN